MNHFRFRAELLTDAANFILETKNIDKEIILNFSIVSIKSDLPDVTVDIFTLYEKEEILKLMAKVEDSHVMQQTLTNFEDYTGER